MINKFIRDLVNLLIYGGGFIGLCAACITALSFELTGRVEANLPYLFFIGTVTAALYCGHRVIGLQKLSHIQTTERFEVIRKYEKHIWAYCVLWIGVSVWLFIPIANLDLVLWFIPGGIIGLIYVLPVLPGKRRLRDLGWGKILMIGWSWGWLTAFIPLWNFSEASIQLAVIHGIERMMFIVLISIPFEIRDIQVDRSVGLITLPEKIGKKNINRLALALCILIMLFSFLPSFHYLNPAYCVAMTCSSFAVIPMIRYSYATQDDYFFGGLTDGVMIIALYLFMLVNQFV